MGVDPACSHKAGSSKRTSLLSDHHFDACVDSGAMYILMLKRVYDLPLYEEVGPCEETSVILTGASG